MTHDDDPKPPPEILFIEELRRQTPKARCLLCGDAIHQDERTVNGRTFHEDCYVARYERKETA